MPRSQIAQMERTLAMASRFLDDVRLDVNRSAPAGTDMPPRVRCVHEKPGHTTPEFRTLAIPIPPGLGGASPEILSTTLTRFATTRKPDCMVLAVEAVLADDDGTPGPVLIAEARDQRGTRLFWLQRYRVVDGRVVWSEPTGDGWQDPGEQEMILDAAFVALEAQPRPCGDGRGRRRTPRRDGAVRVADVGVADAVGAEAMVAASVPDDTDVLVAKV